MRVITWCSFGVLAVLLSGCQPQSGSANQSDNAAAAATAADSTADGAVVSGGAGTAVTETTTTTATPAAALVLTAADSGKAVSLRVGESLSLSLEGNASTGYSWALAADGSPVLAQVGSAVATSTAAAPDVVGAPEVNRWTFAAQKTGEATLRLEYRRPWEKDTAAARTFEVKVSVAGE